MQYWKGEIRCEYKDKVTRQIIFLYIFTNLSMLQISLLGDTDLQLLDTTRNKK